LPAKVPIVGIGASAGGVEALEAFFKAMPDDNGMAFVVITHLAPNQKSMLAEILARVTRMPVVHAEDAMPVDTEHVYVLPPGAMLSISGGRLRMRHTTAPERERTPIDIFFSALADDQGERAIGIVLSGGGNDGTLGLRAIKEHGGLTVAQGSNLSRPRFSEMPSSAVAAGFVDLLLPVEEMPERLVGYVRNWGRFEAEEPTTALPEIFRLLHARTGHDFSEYKDRTFQRRVQRRMQVLHAADLAEYVARLRTQPDEVSALFRDLLIGVTDFFRDPAAFRALETLVIPKLVEGKGADDEVRVWVAGCSTGEEAYSIAILLREQMDRLSAGPRVQVFASDIDESAMAAARAGRYPATVLKEVSPERLRRFFTADGGAYRVAKDLRDMCIFSTHSVIRDPPFSRLDLISCRNLMIYLKPELQAQVIPVFHYALRARGYLFLGLSENVTRHSDLFTPIDKKNRIFQRRELAVAPNLPLRQFLPRGNRGAGVATGGRGPLLQRSDLLRKIASTVVDHFSPTYVIVDDTGEALFYSAGTGKYLQPAAGAATREIVAMARPGLRVDLRLALYRAKESGQRVVRDRISVQINGGIQMIGLTVEPIVEDGETVYAIVFADQGPIRSQEEIGAGPAPADAGMAQQIERELQETKERLQSTIEELETANEEFRSSNEELLSVNEELQSTNEELETSKEELQSVNEELQTVNNELSHKVDELDRANNDLNNLFRSTQIATVFLDRNLVIRSFTPAVTRIFNLIPGDRGRPLTDIVGRVNYPELEGDIQAVFAGAEVIERSVSLSGGKTHFLARILPYRGSADAIDGAVVTFVDVSNLVAAEEQQKLLAAELSHRVKNTLAVVMSIAERTLPANQAKETLLGRLHALAHTQSLLTATRWNEVPLRELIQAEMAPHTASDSRNVRIAGPEIMLKPRAALFLALAIHELTTNASKYGALSDAAGLIEIGWNVTGYTPPQLTFDWTERNGPKSPEIAKHGFGVDLIERGTPFELGGRATLETVDGALHCRLVIPATPENMTLATESG
jgi:two-component system CheB/CheR fusion protein